MLIRLFRTSHPVNFFLLPGVALLLHIPLFFQEELIATSGAFIFSNAQSWIAISPALFVLISALIIGITGVFLNFISDQFNFLDRVSGLTGLAYVIVASALTESVVFNADFLVLPFVLIALYQILSLSSGKAQPNMVFNAGVLISLASLVVPHLLGLQLLVVVGILYFQTFQWRCISIHIIATLLPLVYFYGYDLIWGEGFFIQAYFGSIILTWKALFEPSSILSLLIPFIIIIWSARSYLNGVSSNTLRRRKALLLMLWALLILLVVTLQSENPVASIPNVLAIPLAFLLANYLYFAKKTVIADLFLLLIIGWQLAAYWI